MINQSRRTLLKGIGYGMAAVATGGAASTVMAASATAVSDAAVNESLQFVMASCDITIYLQQTVGKEIVSLMNLTDKPVTLDSIKPVGLQHINGSLVVKLNNVSDGSVVMQPGERLAFEVEATSHGEAGINQLLSIWGMTALQHSALRVIYVHDTENIGIPSGEIGKHLVTRVPDVTRLLDRMADKGWLVRERDASNRRVVRARLTDIGVELVESVHSSLEAFEKEQLAHLSDDEKAKLKYLLDKAIPKT